MFFLFLYIFVSFHSVWFQFSQIYFIGGGGRILLLCRGYSQRVLCPTNKVMSVCLYIPLNPISMWMDTAQDFSRVEAFLLVLPVAFVIDETQDTVLTKITSRNILHFTHTSAVFLKIFILINIHLYTYTCLYILIYTSIAVHKCKQYTTVSLPSRLGL